MGCASSRVENEGIVARCKARRKYMKQAVSSRHQFAAAHGYYLQSLRNTGAALRQFAEGESMETDITHHYATQNHHRCQSMAPRPLPPPPPPLPEMSPYSTTTPPPPSNDFSYGGGGGDGGSAAAAAASPHQRSEAGWTTSSSSQNSAVAAAPPPPPPAQASAWDFWNVFAPASPRRAVMEDQQPPPPPLPLPHQPQQEARRMEWEATAAEHHQLHQSQAQFRVQEWEEATTMTTTTEMEYERGVHENNHNSIIKSPERQTDDNSSMVSSWYTKESDMAMVVSKTSKDIGAVMRELDEYFLKASTAGREVSVLLETSKSFQSTANEPIGNFQHSAKVFSAFSWGWPSRSPLSMRRDYVDLSKDECGTLGSHCSTLERLYAWEKKLYDEVRNGESTKVELDKKEALLRKQKLKGEDGMKIEKTKADIDRLQSQIMVAVQAVDTTSAAILKLRESELHPQLVELSKGLMYMWRTMYECHHVQNHIVEHVKRLNIPTSTEPTSDYHRHATIQLETQVTAWHENFCRLMKSHREYVRALNGWLKLSLNQFSNEVDGFMDNHRPLYTLCEEWQLALERLPDQSVCGGIKSFITVVHAIVVQQAEELKQEKKSASLSKELEKKLISLRNLENKHYNPYATPERRGTDSKDRLAQKAAKIEVLKRRVEEEKSKHLKAIRVSREMTLNNLRTGLPSVFQAMTGFSSVCMQAFESVYNQAKSFNYNPCIKRLT